MPRPIKFSAQHDNLTIFAGGLDLKTPTYKLKSGFVRRSQNWQCVPSFETGGYERIGGYERFDGGTPPSSATYTTLIFANWVHQPSDWNWMTIPPTWPNAVNWPSTWEQAYVIGGTSGAIAKIVTYVDPTITDAYAGQYYLAVTSTNGTFQVGESINIAGANNAGNIGGMVATVGVLTGFAVTPPMSARANAQLIDRSADMVRQNKPVPGSGRVLGVVSVVFNGTRQVYAFRNTEDGTAARLYRAEDFRAAFFTSAREGQWSPVPLYHEVHFINGGPIPPADGDTILRVSRTATIKRVVLESGEWSNGSAAGRFIITQPTPFDFSPGLATIGGVTVTLTSANTPITLLPNGRYEFEVFNFYGQLKTRRLYGVDAVNRAFEFDGEVFVPIETKATTDVPSHLRAHQHHLFLSIGSSWMISGPGVPYEFAASSGGKEIAVGDEIVGALVQPGNADTGAMASFGRNSSGVIYGSSGADWNYKAFPSLFGSIPFMQQNLDRSYMLDDRGILSLSAAQEFGNFAQATLSKNIDAFLIPRKSLAVGSCVSTDRSQFRLFFADGTALYTTIVNGRLLGHMPQAFPHAFSCVWSSEDASGNEETFAGGQTGHVYQLDRGSSFDGQPIEHFMELAIDFVRSPRVKKKWRDAQLEVLSDFYAEFNVGYRLEFNDARLFQGESEVYASNYQSALAWDAFVWDQATWDGATLSPTRLDLKGQSTCYQMVFAGSSDFIYPFTLTSQLTDYTPLRRAT